MQVKELQVRAQLVVECVFISTCLLVVSENYCKQAAARFFCALYVLDVILH